MDDINSVQDSELNRASFSTLLDSGDRTQFSSGAVRDMHTGKGRCDLMPLDVVCDIFNANSILPNMDRNVLRVSGIL